jgi:hypothetical protein
MSNPVVGVIQCERCEGLANVKERKVGHKGERIYLSYCPSCKDMVQKGDDKTQERLAAFSVLRPDPVIEVAQVKPLSTPVSEPQAAENEDFVNVDERGQPRSSTPLEPRSSTPLDPRRTNPPAPRRFWVPAGLACLGGLLFAMARIVK